MLAIVRNPDEGDIFVKDLNGEQFVISAHEQYKMLGLCEMTFQAVIRDSEHQIFIAQSIDFDYKEEASDDTRSHV